MDSPAQRVAGRTAASVIVEFCGLPGAGKSYVARLVCGVLRDHGTLAQVDDDAVGPDAATPRRLARKLRLVCAQGLASPMASINVVACVGAGQRHRSSSLSRSAQWLVTQGLLAEARRLSGVHLFQEGVVQALWSIGIRGGVDGMLRMLEEGAVPLLEPDLVIEVDAPAEVIRERLGRRRSRHSRTQRLPAVELGAELDRGALLLDELLAWWRGSGVGRRDTLRLSNHGDRQPAIDCIVGWIESLAPV